MKATLDPKDDLLIQAKKLTKRTGRPLRAVGEERLRHTLSQAEQQSSYKLPDVSVADPSATDPLESQFHDQAKDPLKTLAEGSQSGSIPWPWLYEF